MNINLDNYESFFLLYVDNELSAAERKSVEEFLGNYPYLQQEMDLFKETVLPVEENSFAFKAGLLKPVMPEELLQENLLLHLDNELAGEQKQHLENLLLKDDKLQKEWALLKRTKLETNEKVVFPDKSMLYRHERGKLVVGRFVRWAVAAAVIGAGIFVGINFLNNNVGVPPELTVKTDQPGPPGVPSTAEAPTNNTAVVAGTAGQNVEQPLSSTPAVAALVKETTHVSRNNNIQKDAPGSKQDMVTSNRQKTAIEKPVERNQRERMVEKTESGTREMARIEKPGTNDSRNSMVVASVKNKPVVLEDINIQPVENLFARNASFDADENSDDHIFMMDEDKVSRTKAAGFLKKIKRTVERTTKIKPGNSLKIAGFEFAVK